MSEPASQSDPVTAGDGRRPRPYVAIAHRAGNNLHHLDLALEARVDAIECDFWHARGRLVLRHEPKLPGKPVLFDKWFVRWAWGVISLRRLLREINFRADLFLDIKSSSLRAADAVLELHQDHDAMMPRTDVSSNQWKLLDRLATAGTDMRMFYSVGRHDAINALLRRAERDHPPAGTSIRHTLLSPALVERLHAANLIVYAWTVNNDNRARELLSWGVDGIISDDAGIFEELDKDAEATSGSGAQPSP
ncbi:MAG: glycerophosphodiester phosphodiesterase [Dehalococcoidia bacterium]